MYDVGMLNNVAMPSPAEFRALIRPNRSMSPRAMAVIVICFAVLALTIALSFLTLGLWLVLPFAGLEIFVLGVVFAVVSQRANDFDLVIVNDDEVTITQRRGKAESLRRFQRYWTRVRFEPGATRYQAPRLLVGSQGQFIEVGATMTEDAKHRLSQQLREAIGRG